jgi:hypothetical protein
LRRNSLILNNDSHRTHVFLCSLSLLFSFKLFIIVFLCKSQDSHCVQNRSVNNLTPIIHTIKDYNPNKTLSAIRSMVRKLHSHRDSGGWQRLPLCHCTVSSHQAEICQKYKNLSEITFTLTTCHVCSTS